MSEESHSSELTAREKILVAMAVLLDGFDSEKILAINLERGEALMSFAKVLNSKSPTDRLPQVATILRRAKKDFTDNSR